MANPLVGHSSRIKIYLFSIVATCWWTIVYTKKIDIFDSTRIWTSKNEHESNIIPYPWQKYLSGPVWKLNS